MVFCISVSPAALARGAARAIPPDGARLAAGAAAGRGAAATKHQHRYKGETLHSPGD